MLLVLTAERSPWNNNKLSPSWTETINTLTSTTTIIILFNFCFLESSLLNHFYFYVSNHRNLEIITFFYCSSHETRCKHYRRFFSFPLFLFRSYVYYSLLFTSPLVPFSNLQILLQGFQIKVGGGETRKK